MINTFQITNEFISVAIVTSLTTAPTLTLPNREGGFYTMYCDVSRIGFGGF